MFDGMKNAIIRSKGEVDFAFKISKTNVSMKLSCILFEKLLVVTMATGSSVIVDKCTVTENPQSSSSSFVTVFKLSGGISLHVTDSK